jgi:aminopeptidase N
MKKFILFTELLLSVGLCFAQIPKVDSDLMRDIAAQKEEHARRMMSCERRMTANQEDFDVTYYSLDLVPDPASSVLSGIVEVAGEILSSSLDYVELNFWDGMIVTDVHASDSPAVPLGFTLNNDILSVGLGRSYAQGESFRLTVTYYGLSQNSPYGSFGFGSHNGNTMIWTLSEPFGARAWWPCKDVPSDKADSVDIRVTVPDGLVVASNGALRQTVSSGGNTTWFWHEGHPISTYLVSLAIHPYEVHYDDFLYNGGADTMKIHFYTFPGQYDLHADINSKVKDMLACFSGLFGPYPFLDEKYGHADFIWSGGMEHQTCTSFGAWTEYLYAHELSHQWWGDMITCGSYHDIWLNEGFATYSEALWFEHTYGLRASEYETTYKSYFGPGTVYVEDLENDRIFDYNLTYCKASWVLHMLRHVVGDDVFFNILKTYGASPEHQYGTVTTEQFRALCERISGKNLEKFFHQWIYEEYYPRYSFSWDWASNESGYDIGLTIRQDQENWIFWMPIDVTVTTAGGETAFVVLDSLQTQTFHLQVLSKPTALQLDRDNWILKTGGDSPSVDSYALEQNYPNPFNAGTTIVYDIPQAGRVRLTVYDVLGHSVRTLANAWQQAGRIEANWDGKDGLGLPVSAGLYFCRMEAGNFKRVIKMMLVK